MLPLHQWLKIWQWFGKRLVMDIFQCFISAGQSPSLGEFSGSLMSSQLSVNTLVIAADWVIMWGGVRAQVIVVNSEVLIVAYNNDSFYWRGLNIWTIKEYIYIYINHLSYFSQSYFFFVYLYPLHTSIYVYKLHCLTMLTFQSTSTTLNWFSWIWFVLCKFSPI